MVPDYDVADITYNPPPEQISDNLFYLSLLKSKAMVIEGQGLCVAGYIDRIKTNGRGLLSLPDVSYDH